MIPAPQPKLQDLPPKWAHWCLSIERFVRDELGADIAGSKLIVAVSGGVDSVALLYVLRMLAPRLGCTLHAAHLDHGLRPESGDDAAFVRALCAGWDIPCNVESADVAAFAEVTSTGLEEAGRMLRYGFLDRVRDHAGADWVCTGHTLNDLAEDQLMRQLRGAGWPGLGGLAGVDANRRLLRPLLATPKEQLREFATSLEIPWREDDTNADPAFLRNRVRTEMLPLFLRENPNYLDTALSLWKQARQDEDYWNAAVAAVVQETDDGFAIPIDALDRHGEALAARAIKEALTRLGPGQALSKNVDDLLRAWRERRTGAVVQFPGGKAVTITREALLLACQKSANSA